jgi:CheY-like chemotaxis protein
MKRMLERLGVDCEVVDDGLAVIPALQATGQVPRDLGPIPGVHLVDGAGNAAEYLRPPGAALDIAVPSLKSGGGGAGAAHASSGGAAVVGTGPSGGSPTAPPFDVIFLDIIMRMSDGAQVCAALRSIPGLEHMPIFAATGNGNAVATLTAAGFTGILTKPFSLPALRPVLEFVRSAAAASDGTA